MGDGHLARLQRGIEHGDEHQLVLACDALVEPVDEAERRPLIEALLGVGAGGQARARTAAFRAVARLFRPGMPGARVCAEVASFSPFIGGAALDALAVMLRLEPALAAEVREALAAQPDERAGRVAVACVVLGPALVEAGGPLQAGEAALVELLRRSLLVAPSVRLCEALGALGLRARAASPALRALCESGDLALASAALAALLAIAPDATETTSAIRALLARPQAHAVQWTLEACHDALQSGPAPAALLALPTSALLPLLEPFWSSATRAACCDLLALLGGPSELDRLASLIFEPEWPLRVAASEAVAAIVRRGADASALLARLEGHRSREHRTLALGLRLLLGPSDETRSTLLRVATSDRDSLLRENATALLRSCADAEARASLAARLSPSTAATERRRVALVLSKIGPDPSALPALLAGLHDADASVRRSCCLAVGAVGASHGVRSVASAIPTLLRRLADGNAAAAARLAFSLLGPLDGPFPIPTSSPVDWPALFRLAFSAVDPAPWRPVLLGRLAWSARLLGVTQPEAPDDLFDLASLLADLAHRRVLRRNHSQKNHLASGASAEFAWSLARLWHLSARGALSVTS